MEREGAETYPPGSSVKYEYFWWGYSAFSESIFYFLLCCFRIWGSEPTLACFIPFPGCAHACVCTLTSTQGSTHSQGSAHSQRHTDMLTHNYICTHLHVQHTFTPSHRHTLTCSHTCRHVHFVPRHIHEGKGYTYEPKEPTYVMQSVQSEIPNLMQITENQKLQCLHYCGLMH